MFFSKKEPYKDYTVEDFSDSSEQQLLEDIKKNQEASNYITWIQSFSKKIVSITFVMYLIITVVVLAILIINTKAGNGDISNVYSEINETFRVVIGGYLIKAGIENAFKISGNYLVGISGTRLKLLQKKYGVDPASSNGEESDTSEY